ncbi:Peroxiredoxin [hydrothermal vent metagenome]|uniref:Peroxiredoxin n=1 Tax=hydrothermal vent metagenome TaxID=652676 RepID=A0A3B0TXI2_9ZZZZ
MTISVGETLPETVFMVKTASGVDKLTTADIFAGKTVAMFGVPGAFTPTCHAKHLPGYIEALDRFNARGVDTVVCLSVNDAHVMRAWAEAMDGAGGILFLADGNADFAKAAGLDLDASAGGMGVRCRRFSMLVRDGVVAALHLEPAPGQAVETSAEKLLQSL